MYCAWRKYIWAYWWHRAGRWHLLSATACILPPHTPEPPTTPTFPHLTTTLCTGTSRPMGLGWWCQQACCTCRSAYALAPCYAPPAIPFLGRTTTTGALHSSWPGVASLDKPGLPVIHFSSKPPSYCRHLAAPLRASRLMNHLPLSHRPPMNISPPNAAYTLTRIFNTNAPVGCIRGRRRMAVLYASPYDAFCDVACLSRLHVRLL